MNFKDFVAYKENFPQEQYNTISSLGIMIDYFEENPDDLSFFPQYFNNLRRILIAHLPLINKIKSTKPYDTIQSTMTLRKALQALIGSTIGDATHIDQGGHADAGIIANVIHRIGNLNFLIKMWPDQNANDPHLEMIQDVIDEIKNQLVRIRYIAQINTPKKPT